MKEERNSSAFLPLLFSIVLALGIFIGTYLNKPFVNVPFLPSKINEFNKLNAVINYIQQAYVDTINGKDLVNKSITDILSHLDPHSVYISSDELQGVNEPLEGNFEGIGIEFHMQGDTIMVVAPVAGGPSEAVGIKSGDRIIKIENKNVAGVNISTTEIMQKLRGASGTKVNVWVLRRGKKEPIKFSITRGKIPLYSIDASYMVNDTIGYIKIARFAAITYEEFMQSLKQLQAKGLKHLILDLKGNTGGFLNAAVSIADEFLPNKKLIVYTEGKARPKEFYYATEKGSFEHGKLIVLLDEGSASASEILSGALQDLDRAIIVGRRSFGKGLVQEQTVFPDGSAIRLTIARYYTPTGRSIQKSYSNGLEKYNDELFNRYKSGELENADSIKIIDSLKYTTPTGKVVYGGGGIMPDVFVPIDTTLLNNNFLIKVLNGGVINEFTYDFVDENRDLLSKYNSLPEFKEKFSITSNTYKRFLEFATKTGVKGSSKTSENFIKNALKASVARQLWKNYGFYSISNEIDKDFQKGVELIVGKDKGITLH